MLVSKNIDRQLIKIFGFLLVFLALCFSIAINSFKNGKFTCNKYILNTYLYIVLTFNIIILMTLMMEYNNVSPLRSGWILFGLFLITIGCIIFMNNMSPDKVILKHLIWLVFVFIIGYIFFPMYTYSNKGVVASAMVTTLAIVVLLSIVAFVKPEWISLSIGPMLLVGLIAVIIMELILFFFFRTKLLENPWIFRSISYFVIFLFMGFILHDTKRLQINAKQCVKADYISESLHLFLDIFNIFVRLVGLGRR